MDFSIEHGVSVQFAMLAITMVNLSKTDVGLCEVLATSDGDKQPQPETIAIQTRF